MAIPEMNEATDVSADGSVAVGREGEAAFRWTQQGGTEQLPEARSAYCVSDDGTVVGGQTKDANGYLRDAFRWTVQGGTQHLGSLQGDESCVTDMSADGSVLVGTSKGSGGWYYPMYWTEATGMIYVDAGPAQGSGNPTISGNGEVLYVHGNWGAAYRMTGLYIDTSDPRYPWYDTPVLRGQTLDFQDLPGGAYYCFIADTTPDGSVAVGTTRDAESGPNQAMIWDAEHGIGKIKDMLESDYGLNLDGWDLGSATGISANGRVIVGRGSNPSGYGEAWIANLGPSVLPGDYNEDGIVDAADYTVWRDGLGTIYTEADFGVWKEHFGETSSDGASSNLATYASRVPEPSTLLLFICAVAMLLRNHGKWQRARW